MKIATFNVNGIRSRLPHLLALARARTARRRLPAGTEGARRGVPDRGDPRRRLRRDLARPEVAGTASPSSRAACEPVESRRGLPGDPDDTHSRYLEAAVHGVVVGCLYLPNGNPQPGPKFDYKLQWFERFISHAQTLYDSGHPVVLGGDYNVVPTDFDIYNPKSLAQGRAAAAGKPRRATQRLLAQGWTDALRTLHPGREDLHVLGLLPPALAAQRGPAHRPPAAERRRSRRGCVDAGVDRWVRGLKGASDHAPTWIELDL